MVLYYLGTIICQQTRKPTGNFDAASDGHKSQVKSLFLFLTERTGPGMISTRAENSVSPLQPLALGNTYLTFYPTPGIRSTEAVSGSPQGVTAPMSLPFLD